MNNFSIAQNATATAINSTGSAMKEQEKYADSLEARLNRLDTAWNKFTLAIGEAVLTDGLIGGIESLNDLATGVAKLVDKFGLLSGLFGIVGVATVALSTKFRTFTASMLLGTTGMTRMQLASAGLTAGMTRLGVATVGVKTALRGLLASTVVGAVFVGLGFIIEKLIGKYSEAKQAQEDFEQSQLKSVDALTKNKQETEKLIMSYNNLSEIKGRSAKQEEQYLSVQTKLAEMYPQLISHIDGSGQAHLKSREEIEKEVEATNQLIEAKKLEAQADAKKNIIKSTNKRDDIAKEIERIETALANPIDIKGYGDNQTITKKSEEDIKRLKSQLLIYQNQWSTAAQVVTSEVIKVADAYTKLQIDPNISQGVNEFFSSFDTTKLDPTQLEAFAVQIGNAKDAMQKAYSSGDVEGFNKARDAIKNIALQMGASERQVYGFTMSFDGLKEAAEKGASAVFAGKDGMDGLDDTALGLTDTMNGLTDAYSENTIALDENTSAAEILFGVTSEQIAMAENAVAVIQMLSGMENLSAQQKELLAQATAELTKMYPHLNGSISENIGWISKQLGMLSSLSDVSGENSTKMITNQNATTRATIEQINQRIAGYNKEIEALNNLMTRIASAYDEEGLTNNKKRAYTDAQKRIAEIQSELAQAQASRVEAYYGSGVESGVIKSTEQSTKATKEFNEALEKLNLEIAKQQKLQNQYPKTSKQYQDAVKNEIKLLQTKKKLLADQSKSLSTQISSGSFSSSSSSVVPTSTSASGGSTSAQIWNFFNSKGFSDTVIAGIMGNLQMESRLNPNAVNPNGGASGIAQWLGGRKTGLQNYAKSMGTSWNDLQTQLEWLWKELNSSEKRTLNYLQSNQSASASTIAYEFDRLFERSEGTHRPQRAKYANEFLNQFAGTSGSPVVSTSVSSSGSGDINQAKGDLLQIQQEILGIDDAIRELNFALVQSVTAESDRKINSYRDDLAKLDLIQSKFTVQFSEWSKAENERIRQFGKQKEYQQQAIDYLNEQYRTNTALTSAQRSQIAEEVLDRTVEIYNLDTAINEATMRLLQAYTSEQDRKIQSYSDDASRIEHYQSLLDQTSEAWRKLQSEHIYDLGKQAEYSKQSIDYLEKQIATNKILNEAQKAQFREDLISRMSEYWQLQQSITDANRELAQSRLSETLDSIADSYDKLSDSISDLDHKTSLEKDEVERAKLLKQQIELLKERQRLAEANLNSLEAERKKVAQFPELVNQIEDEIEQWTDTSKQVSQEIESAYSNLADNIIDIYKDMYDRQKEAALKVIDDEMDAYRKATQERLDLIDKEEQARDYDKDLADRQKDLADIQSKIDLLRLDDSQSGKARLKELLEQQAQMQEEIAETQHDRGVELRKEALQEELEAKEESLEQERQQVEQYYSELINNERNYNALREQLMQGHLGVLQNDLNNFSSFVKQNMEDIGKSISTNLLDKLSAAKIGLSSVNGGVTSTKSTSLHSFDTGGFTGNSEGLAILHKKEIILNKEDTSNLLSSIKLLRPIADFIKKPMLSQLIPSASATTSSPISIVIENLSVAGGKQGFNDLMKEFNNRFAGKGLNTRV